MTKPSVSQSNYDRTLTGVKEGMWCCFRAGKSTEGGDEVNGKGLGLKT